MIISKIFRGQKLTPAVRFHFTVGTSCSIFSKSGLFAGSSFLESKPGVSKPVSSDKSSGSGDGGEEETNCVD
jgi:hypothetical protein